MPLTREQADANVQRGMALLDEKVPDWLDAIVLDELELACTQTCILGQVCGHYSHGVDELGGEHMTYMEALRWSYHHGFNLLINSPESQWQVLNDAWKAAILRRRKGGAT